MRPEGTDYSGNAIAAILSQAVLAQSNHHTQPWDFSVEGNRTRLYAARFRALDEALAA